MEMPLPKQLQCKTGHDQRYLNLAFPSWRAIDRNVWRVESPKTVAFAAANGGCNLDVDSLHYYSGQPPWEGCAVPSRHGRLCENVVRLFQRPEQAQNCTVLRSAQATWWGAFRRLPRETRAVCARRFGMPEVE